MSFGLGNVVPVVDPASIDSSTPWVAASDGNLPLLQAALEQLQLPVTAADENGYTLLQAAASYGQVEVMKWLLSKDVNVNALDAEGDSALHYASTTESTKFLIEVAKIDPNLRNTSGKSALESKKEELDEMMQDEDNDDEDDDFTNLKAVVEYLERMVTSPQ